MSDSSFEVNTTARADNPRLLGVLGVFDGPNELLQAAKKVKSASFKSFDTFTPFPVHGMDDVQGLRRSPIPYVTFAAGLTGCALGFIFQYWTSAVDWPVNIGGKPLNSVPAFIPVIFEMTILFGGLATAGAMFFFNRLPNIFSASPCSESIGITKDKFALLIEAPDLDFDINDATVFLKKCGAKEVRSVFEKGWFG